MRGWLPTAMPAAMAVVVRFGTHNTAESPGWALASPHYLRHLVRESSSPKAMATLECVVV